MRGSPRTVAKPAGPIVLRQRIARAHPPARRSCRNPGRAAFAGKREQILAGGQLDLLFAQKLFVAIEPHGGRLRLVGLDEDFDLEGLAFFELGWHLDFLNGNIVGPRDAHRHNIDRDSQRLGRQHALMASPMFSLPSVSSTRRFWPVSGNAAVPSRIAAARSVRSVSDHRLDFLQDPPPRWAPIRCWLRCRRRSRRPCRLFSFAWRLC